MVRRPWPKKPGSRPSLASTFRQSAPIRDAVPPKPSWTTSSPRRSSLPGGGSTTSHPTLGRGSSVSRARTLSTQLRSARRRSSLVEKLKVVERDETFSQVDRPDSTGVIASLERLSTKDQEVLALAAWEQLSPREAAVVMGMSPARYRVRLHRAKRRLLRELERPATGSAVGQPVPVPLTRHEVAK